MLESVEWGEYRLGDLFEIKSTSSFNKEVLTLGSEYDYVTRTSQDQGILQTTGFVNEENLNEAGTWSLGLLQMDFFYRRKCWYAGQFVRKIVPKIELTDSSISFFTTILNKQKPILLSVLVRDVDAVFRNKTCLLPTHNGEIDFEFMEKFIAELKALRIAELKAYLFVTGLKDYTLTPEEEQAIKNFEAGNVEWGKYRFEKVFNHIKQGRRLKKDDQKEGAIPFVMAGTSNTGVINYISNPIATFPPNSITIDIFGNTFYRNYGFGAGDDTGVYWDDQKNYSQELMLFFTTAMSRALVGKYSFGKKLRSSQSLKEQMFLLEHQGSPDYSGMKTFISAIQKLVIKEVVLYADREIEATKQVLNKTSNRNLI
ncbi:restriction endonuclease subunit S [Porphyromonas sp. COT-239 OH1446]|uniref:restriction endonuclease subunit S n=1 Tax=Porphyromonas sp. COT-239 OH1446 TaxID=1515613 RepID=UPI00052DFB47|nr:restriction endonuclease subunit S [Porphyromonas sp. COT-239 OH1446]KGN71572.1 hypothetical protein HQ37_01520 [Porphyromonas sp. COT-239 OH1446]